MKDDGLRSTVCLLTPEEQRMLLFRDQGAEQEETAADIEIGLGVRALLTDLEASINALLHLLEQQRAADAFPLGIRTDYAALVGRVSSASKRISKLMEASGEFDAEYPVSTWQASVRRQ